jgi:predicted SprT family Zn-dependent metalloprotease
VQLHAAYELAVSLVEDHGLSGWTVDFDMAKRRAGVCRYEKRIIGLSAPLTRLHDEAEVRDTILHEIAHALAGPAAGHGPEWQAKARSIGCSATRCLPADAPRVPGAWLGVCSAGHVVERHKRPVRVMACGRCGPGFSADNIFEWTYRGHPAPMHPNYDAELQALLTGKKLARLGAGARVRITAPGQFHGRMGTVVKRGQSRYHVQLKEGILRVVFSAVERA